MPPIPCKTCTADNTDELEAVGLRAMAGEISWREAAREVGWTRHQALQTHMNNHYVAGAVKEATDELDVLIVEAVGDLREAMRMAPAEVKPLYAAAIVNLQGLKNTKPSQQHLIQALKTIQEMTGMRQEQRMMLAYAEQMFGEVVPPSLKAIEAIADAEIVDVLEAST